MEIVSLFFNLPSGHEFQGKAKLGKICESLLGKKRRSFFFQGNADSILTKVAALYRRQLLLAVTC